MLPENQNLEMSMRISGPGCFISSLFLAAGIASAQNPSYHLQYVPVDQQSTRILLVNDTQNTIEAFRLVQECPLIRNRMDQDVLYTPVHPSAIRNSEGEVGKSIGVEPGGTWEIFGFQNAEKAMNVGECAPRFELILFGDGSYEGNESAARAVKAQRDGLLAGITEWQEILSKQDVDGADVDQLAAEANQREEDDRQKVHETFVSASSRHGDESAKLAHEFWSGKMIVDSNIAGRLRANGNAQAARQSFQRAKSFVEEWKNKFDADLAMQKLNEVFPPFAPNE